MFATRASSRLTMPSVFDVSATHQTRTRQTRLWLAVQQGAGDDDANARKGRRRERNAQLIMFRRGAYKNLDEKAPWLTTWSAASEKLNVVEGVYASDAQAALNRKFIVEAYVEPAGASGFFIDGIVTGDVFVKCACCGANYAMALPDASDDYADDAVRFLAFLDADAKEESTSGDYDVFPFSRSIEELDLTPLVRDSVRAFGLPPETVCAECDGGDGNFATWSIDDAVNAAP